MQKHYENDFNFTPLTYSLPDDQDSLQYIMIKKKGKTFIAKPQGGAEGNGIFLIQKQTSFLFDFNYSFKDLPSYTFKQGFIVQEYLDNPLLVNQKKFDLRIYILVTCLDPLTAYIADEGLVRFCTEDYLKPEKDNLKQTLMHLTNFSLNKLSDKYVNCQDIKDQAQATKRTLSSLFELLKAEKVDTDYLFEQIKDTCTKALIAIQPYVLREQERLLKIIKGTCFQILGFDIFVDSKLKAWLLEINDHPSLNINIETLDGKPPELSPIDQYVKSKILGEAIQMVRFPDQKGGWIHIMPNKEFQEYQTFTLAKKLYDNLTGKKGTNSLSSIRFSKLSLIMPPECKLHKLHFELLYKKVCSQQKTMTLELFFQALECLSDQVYPYEIDRLDMLINWLKHQSL